MAEEAELAGLVGGDADNLGNAIEGESYEVETMYREFAEQADDDGDQAAASRFAKCAATKWVTATHTKPRWSS